jgi:hypothetical protein
MADWHSMLSDRSMLGSDTNIVVRSRISAWDVLSHTPALRFMMTALGR